MYFVLVKPLLPTTVKGYRRFKKCNFFVKPADSKGFIFKKQAFNRKKYSVFRYAILYLFLYLQYG